MKIQLVLISSGVMLLFVCLKRHFCNTLFSNNLLINKPLYTIIAKINVETTCFILGCVRYFRNKINLQRTERTFVFRVRLDLFTNTKCKMSLNPVFLQIIRGFLIVKLFFVFVTSIFI